MTRDGREEEIQETVKSAHRDKTNARRRSYLAVTRPPAVLNTKGVSGALERLDLGDAEPTPP